MSASIELLHKPGRGYRRLIPCMTAMLEFEAVARLNSFTLAAQELGLTQAAVSKQVRLLESSLDARLFERLHRSIRLTPEGHALQRALSTAMQQVAATFDSIAYRQPPLAHGTDNA